MTENQKNQITDPSKKGQEASLELTAAGVQTPDSKVRDHLLLTVQAVVHGTSLRALVDSGATRSFVDERIRLHPPLQFIGAYSSLEMANGETIVLYRRCPRCPDQSRGCSISIHPDCCAHDGWD